MPAPTGIGLPKFIVAEQPPRHGNAIICDPSELSERDGVLVHAKGPIDLVYNRLVDFDLSQPQHVALRRAYSDSAAVLTPTPHNHATLADKRNLVLLSDPARLAEIGAAFGDIETLRQAPLFGLLDDDELAVLAAEVELVEFAPRQRIYRNLQLYSPTMMAARRQTTSSDRFEVEIEQHLTK